MERSNGNRKSRTRGRTIAVGSVGNILEWFDFSIYGYFAPVIAQVFFPAGDHLLSLLARTVAHTNSTDATGRHIRFKKDFQKVNKLRGGQESGKKRLATGRGTG
jgi:hypothetical protein